MHNIRKIKKKKNHHKVMDSEQLAQQKLFQISRFDEEQEKKQDDIDRFLEKLYPQSSSLPPVKSSQSPIKKEYNRMNQYLDQFDRIDRVSDTFTSLKGIRSQSSDLTGGKQPISLINYLVIDQRQGQRKHLNKIKIQALMNLKRKFYSKRNKSQQVQSVSMEHLKPKKKLVYVVKDNQSNAAPMQIKHYTPYSRYTGLN